VQTFRLEAGSSLMLLEWYTAGRMAMGERWAFDRVTSRNEVWGPSGRVFRDGLDLDSADGELVAPHRLGRFNCLATLLLLGPAFGRQTMDILGRTRALPVPVGGDLVQSASPVADGVVWRVAGVRHEDVARELRPHLSATADVLADDPWSRKW
jgi:urease accessory protein